MNELPRLFGEMMRITAKLEDDISIKSGLKNRKQMKPILCLDLIRHLGSPSYGELLAALPIKITKPSLTMAVDKLIRQGFVQKQQSDIDRRVFNLKMTPKGLGVFDAFDQALTDLTHKICRGLTPEEESQFVLILSKIVKEYGAPFPAYARLSEGDGSKG